MENENHPKRQVINTDFKTKYIPARICDGKELLIKYYAWHPVEQRLKKVTKRFNYMRGKYNMTEIKRFMRDACHQINLDLAVGKNPFIEAESPKGYTKLNDAIDIFLKIKSREMRPDGMRSYNSFCRKLKEWCSNKGYPDISVTLFKKSQALEFMNDLTLRDDISNRTWNNYYSFMRGLWNWFIQNEYCKDNPFITFQSKREAQKKRIIIPVEVTNKVFDFCRQYDPNLEIVIDLVRASFIRISEICRIQIKDLDLNGKVIHIPADKSKTHNDRFAYLPDWLIEKIKKMNLSRYPSSYYLFTQRLAPGIEAIDTRRMDKHWDVARTKIGLDKEMQLYSYRDTGITYLEEQGIPRNVIQKLTDHHSDKMVGRYVHKPNDELISRVVSKISETY
jgi:integrase